MNAAISIERLFEDHADAIRARVARRDPMLADDVVSDTFAVALRRASDIPGGAERAWLFVVADNVLRNHQRSRRRAAAIPDALAPHVAASTPAPSIPVVGDALGSLPARERALLTMTGLEGLSTGEAAARLGIAPGTAMNAMVSGRRRLSARLAALGVVLTTIAAGFVFAQAAQASARQATPPPATVARASAFAPVDGRSVVTAFASASDPIGRPWVRADAVAADGPRAVAS